MVLFTATDNLREFVYRLSPRMGVKEMFERANALLVAYQGGKMVTDQDVYVFLVVCRPDLYQTLTNFMFRQGKDWRCTVTDTAVESFTRAQTNQ